MAIKMPTLMGEQTTKRTPREKANPEGHESLLEETYSRKVAKGGARAEDHCGAGGRNRTSSLRFMNQWRGVAQVLEDLGNPASFLENVTTSICLTLFLFISFQFTLLRFLTL